MWRPDAPGIIPARRCPSATSRTSTIANSSSGAPKVVVAVAEIQHDQDAFRLRVRAQAGTQYQPGVDDHQAPAVLGARHLPRHLLGERLGVRVGLVMLVAGRVPMTLVEAVRTEVLQVGGVPVHGHDAGGEDDALHRRRAVGRFQHIARAPCRRLDEIAHRVLDVPHDEGRGGVEDEGATSHGAVEAIGIQEVGPEEGQRAGAAGRDFAQVRGSFRVAGIAHGRVNVVAALQQPLDEPRRDIPVCTCHEYRPRGWQGLVGHDPPVDW